MLALSPMRPLRSDYLHHRAEAARSRILTTFTLAYQRVKAADPTIGHTTTGLDTEAAEDTKHQPWSHHNRPRHRADKL